MWLELFQSHAFRSRYRDVSKRESEANLAEKQRCQIENGIRYTVDGSEGNSLEPPGTLAAFKHVF